MFMSGIITNIVKLYKKCKTDVDRKPQTASLFSQYNK